MHAHIYCHMHMLCVMPVKSLPGKLAPYKLAPDLLHQCGTDLYP